MYVCICNALTERRVAEAIAQGHRDYSGVLRALGSAPQCGKCRETVEAMIDEAQFAGERALAAQIS